VEALMSNNIAVSITADVADLQVKRAILSSEMRAATADLTAFAKTARTSGMTDQLKAGMLGAADAAAKAKTQISALDTEVKKLRVDSETGGFAKIADSVKGAVAPLTEFREALSGLGEAMIAAFAVERIGEFIKQMGEAAEQTLHTAETFGLAVGEVQRMNAQAALFGVPAEAMTTALQRLDKAFATAKQGGSQQALAFKEVGINLGHGYGQLELWNAALEGLGKMAAGPAKVAAAMAIFGRNIKEIGPLLSLTSEQIAEANTKIAEYGAVNDAAAAKGIALAESLNENKVAGMGLGNVMTDALAPVFKDIVDGLNHLIKGFIESYNAGGVAKIGLDLVAGALKALVLALDYAWTTAQAFWHGLVALVEMGIGPWMIFATVVDDVMHGRFSRALSDGAAATKAWQETMTREVGKAADAFKAYAAYQDQVLHDGKGAALPKAGTGTTDDILTKPKKAKGGASQVSEWTEQLHAQEVASGEFFKDQTEKELAFWQSKVALTKQGSKEWLEVQSKIYEAQKSLAHQAYDDHLATINTQLEADRDSWAKEQADWTQKLAFIKQTFGEESKEYQSAYKEFEAAEREHQHSLAQIQRQGDTERLGELKNNLEADAAIRKQNATAAESQIQERAKGSPLGEVKAAQETAALNKQTSEQAIANTQAVYAAEDALRQQDIANAQKAYGKDSQQYAAAINAKKAADNQFYNTHRVQENQMVAQQVQDQAKIAAAWHSAIDPLVHATGSAIQGLVNGTLTWRQAMLQVGQAIEGVIVGAIEKMVENWIVNLIMGQAQQAVSAEGMVMSNAAVAGAAGVASMAAAPFPIDMGAPAFGASMFADAMGYASMASLAVGTNYVPNDMVAQIHQGERIIPEADNAALMSAVGAGGRGGDTHNYYNTLNHSPTVANPTHDVVKQLETNKRDFARLLKGMHRDGHFAFAR
jgi:hypothetical protein